MSRLGIIVPYRNRKTHLNEFVQAIKKEFKSNKIRYELIVVEQADKKPFNRGKLINIGAKKAMELGCSYIALHDVDMIPEKVDYSPVDRPTHLATEFISDHGEKRIVFDTYFGGVTLFPILDFQRVNGYSNEYWGWGYEDDDLLFRCKETFLDNNLKSVPTLTRNTAGLRFNGWDSRVTIPMEYGLDNYTILISLEPDELDCRKEYEVDEHSVLAIPGYDTGFSYNTFQRYKFETWDKDNKQIYSLKSNIQPPSRICLVATVDQRNEVMRLYLDGVKVDELEFRKKLQHHHEQKEILIGQTGNEGNKRRAFKGVVDYVALWSHSLEEGQVEALSKNLHLGVLENFEGYTNAHSLIAAYDFKISTNKKVLDITGQSKDATVYNCDRVEVNHIEDTTDIVVPWRRESLFKLLPHKDNGFYENKWTYTETRKNQIRFYNEILKGETNWKHDGLDSLKYKVLSENELKDMHFISVEL